jgi:heat shock protein HtpX
MSRTRPGPVLRVLMVAVGAAVFAVYVAGAALVYLLLQAVLLAPSELPTTLALVGAMTLVFGYLSYRFGTSGLLERIDAVPLDRGRARGLYDRVDRLADAMGIEPPELRVARMRAPNALAVGGRGSAVVVLDRSLFDLLTREELEAILAHELAHIERRDSLVSTMAYTAMQTLTGLVLLALFPLLLAVTGAARALALARGRPSAWADTLPGRLRTAIENGVGVVLFGLTLLLFAHSRRREFAADDRAAAVTGRPLALARALRRIDAVTRPGLDLLSPLYVTGDEDGPMRWLSTHPSTEERVERLRERADRTGRDRAGRRVEIR